MYEVEKSDSVGDETVETTSEVRQGHGRHVNCFLRCGDSNDRREQLVRRFEVYTDSDWASDQVTRKSTSGAVIMAEGNEIACSQSGVRLQWH